MANQDNGAQFRFGDTYVFDIEHSATFYAGEETAIDSTLAGQISFQIIKEKKKKYDVELYAIKLTGRGFDIGDQSTGRLSLMGSMGDGSLVVDKNYWKLDISIQNLKFTHPLVHIAQDGGRYVEGHGVLTIPDLFNGTLSATIARSNDRSFVIEFGGLSTQYETGEWGEVTNIALEFNNLVLSDVSVPMSYLR